MRFSIIKFWSTMTECLKIGTHSGTFHTDEALACYMLRKLPEYSNAEIVRSRDDAVLEPCAIVVDVGGVYDPTKQRFDHHQKTFQLSMSSLRPDIESRIRLSSAGLIYHHFGEPILEAVIGKPLDKAQLKKLFSYVYFHFIQEIDAVDNGVPICGNGQPSFGYHTDLSSRVARINPRWNSKESVPEMELFEKAMALAGKEFEECVFRFINEWWPARSIVEQAVDNRFNVHPSGEIIEIQFCPWKAHVFDIEKEQGIEGTIKYAIFSDGQTWRTSAVPITPTDFALRVPLHETWRGIREENLQAISGIPDAIFVHANGFIGGARSRDGAIALAAKTLELSNELSKNNCK